MPWVRCAFGNICLTPSPIVHVLVSLCMTQTKYPPSPKSLTAAPDMRHVQSLLLPPAQVFIYTSNSFVAKLLFHANSNMSGRQWQWTPQFRTWLGCLLALDALHFFWYFDEIFSIYFQYFRNLPDWTLAVHQVHCQHLAFFQDAADVSEPSWWWWCSGWEVGLIRVTFIWMLMIRPYIFKILIPGFSKLF